MQVAAFFRCYFDGFRYNLALKKETTLGWLPLVNNTSTLLILIQHGRLAHRSHYTACYCQVTGNVGYNGGQRYRRSENSSTGGSQGHPDIAEYAEELRGFILHTVDDIAHNAHFDW